MVFGTPAWQTASDKKCVQREAALEEGRHILGDKGTKVSVKSDLEYLSATAAQITENIGKRKKGWTATHVLKAYIRSSLRAQAATNCLTEPLYTQAYEQAQALDAEFAATGRLVGPLHGVPVSVKDQIDVDGVDSTIGFTQKIGQPATADAALVKILKSAGAVPFVKTNIPQTLLSFECGNPVFGVTSNPYDSSRTCGGSSGGEGALLGADGSSIGIGSDIGGSLRIPAHYSGCFGLKPCYGRWPSDGTTSPNPGFEAIKSTFGPMARSVDDLESVMRVMADASVHLSRTLPLIPVQYRTVTLPKKLKFGYFLSDGFCKASPACQRAVMETVRALRHHGHECVEFAPPPPIQASEIMVALTSAGGYQTLLAGLEGDPQESALFLTTLGPKLPWPVRYLASGLLKYVVGDTKMASLISASKIKSVTETQAWLLKRDEYVDHFRKQVWGDFGFDAILCSPQATPALTQGATWNLSPLAIGTFLWNVVDSTVGVVPVTFVDAKKDALTDEWRTTGEPGSKLVEGNVYGPKGAYDPVAMEGLPVGVQVVGASWEEEKVIEIMKVVDEALGPRGFGPGEFAKKHHA